MLIVAFTAFRKQIFVFSDGKTKRLPLARGSNTIQIAVKQSDRRLCCPVESVYNFLYLGLIE